MKLYYLTFSPIPSQKANGVQIMQMCQAFSGLGNRVTLICRQGDMNQSDIRKFYGVRETFNIKPVRVPELPVLDRLFFAFAVLRVLRESDETALLYSRDHFVAGLLCILKPRHLRTVLEIHAPPASWFWLHWIRYTMGRGQLSHIVAITHALAERVGCLLEGFPRSRIIVAHDGADEVPASPSDEQRPKERRWKVGYVGSLRPGKGMELIARLAPLIPEVDFHVVGGDEVAVRNWAARAAHPNLTFHGFVSPDRAHRYIASFDILLAPYQSRVMVGNGKLDISAWMSPLKIFEYMSASKPIIASNLPVLTEVLEHRRNALLVEAEDPLEWKNAIRSLIADERLRLSLAKTAYEDLTSKYTWTKRAELILESVAIDNPMTSEHSHAGTKPVPRWRGQ